MKQKQIIRLTESELKSIISESVKSILMEFGGTVPHQRGLGALYARKALQQRGRDNMELGDKLTQVGDRIGGYAERARRPLDDETNQQLYNSYMQGYLDYLKAHPEEVRDYMDNRPKS